MSQEKCVVWMKNKQKIQKNLIFSIFIG